MTTATIKPIITKFVLTLGLIASMTFAMPRPASADTQSTVAIIAAAAAVVGAIAYDNSGRPYYVRYGHRCYVSPAVVNYYHARGRIRVAPRYRSWNSNPGWNNHNGYGYRGHRH
jgi:hypothetical protein